METVVWHGDDRWRQVHGNGGGGSGGERVHTGVVVWGWRWQHHRRCGVMEIVVLLGTAMMVAAAPA